MAKNRVQIYVQDEDEFKALVAKVAALRKSEGKEYKPWYGLDYTVSEVILDALDQLAQEWDTRQSEAKTKKK